MATDNAHIERFFRTIKYDKLSLEPSKDGNILYKQCKECMHFHSTFCRLVFCPIKQT